MIVQNLPVPFDRRVWLECRALVDAGRQVAVICPKGPGDPSHQVLDGVDIYKYRAYPPTRRMISFVGEYIYSFVMTLWLVARVWWRHGFDVIQACNPPDIFWPIGLTARLVFGSAFVFDQHDLCPELFQSRFATAPQVPLKGLYLLERCTYATADHVIATNGSYKRTALGRGKKRPSDVTIVRTGPDPERLRRRPANGALRRGRRFLVAYLGVMGPQDGVDRVLSSADIIVRRLERRDVSFTLIGSGDCFDELVSLRNRLGLDDYVEFTGRVPDDVVVDVLSTADLGLSPDPRTPLNDVSTMNKTMEYMAFELPVVAFDLHETRVSAGDAAVYVPDDIDAYAKAIVDLLDDEQRRCAMGKLARARVEDRLAWRHQVPAYLQVFDHLESRRRPMIVRR